MRWLKKRKNAWIITLIALIVSTLFSAHSSLSRLKADVEAIFYIGEDNDGMGIQYDLEQIMTNSYNLTIVAGRYLKKTDSKLTAVLENKEILSAVKTPGKKFQAAEALITSTEELYTYLESFPLNLRDKEYRDEILTNIHSHLLIIERSGYNRKVDEFNAIIKNIPANLISSATLIRPLERYEQPTSQNSGETPVTP